MSIRRRGNVQGDWGGGAGGRNLCVPGFWGVQRNGTVVGHNELIS